MFKLSLDFVPVFGVGAYFHW